MVQAISEFRAIKKHAEEIKNDATHTLSDATSPGDCWAQGDLLIVRMDSLPADCLRIAVERQLAPGTTQGSRHCIVDLAGVEMFRLNGATPLDGPILKCAQQVEIDHPEHGNIVLPPGVYGIVYQRQFASELRRVLD